MDENSLISKRELLDRYSISYGALYRWKRKGLIPEDWFLKKATATGQETFFPERLICERVELIQHQKDELSLDELARQLNGIEKETTILMIDTVFGEKRFHMEDIHSIRLESGSGQSIDLTDLIMTARKRETKKYGCNDKQ